jgi:hypothetical protein
MDARTPHLLCHHAAQELWHAARAGCLPQDQELRADSGTCLSKRPGVHCTEPALCSGDVATGHAGCRHHDARGPTSSESRKPASQHTHCCTSCSKLLLVLECTFPCFRKCNMPDGQPTCERLTKELVLRPVGLQAVLVGVHLRVVVVLWGLSILACGTQRCEADQRAAETGHVTIAMPASDLQPLHAGHCVVLYSRGHRYAMTW